MVWICLLLRVPIAKVLLEVRLEWYTREEPGPTPLLQGVN